MLSNSVYGLGGNPDQIFRVSTRVDAPLIHNDSYFDEVLELDTDVIHTDGDNISGIAIIETNVIENSGTDISSVFTIDTNVNYINIVTGSITASGKMIDVATDNR